MESEPEDKTPLRHDHYPTTEAEYEAELTETEAEFEEQLEEVEDKVHGQVQRYLLFGALTVVVNIALFYFLSHTLGIEYQLANFIDWLLVVQGSFWLDRTFVFKHKSNTPFREMGTFYSTRVATYVIEFILLWLGISIIGANGTITKIISHAVAVTVNYFLSMKVVFKHKPAKEETTK